MKSHEAFFIGFFSFFGFLPNAYTREAEEGMRKNLHVSLGSDWQKIGMDFRKVFDRECSKMNEQAPEK